MSRRSEAGKLPAGGRAAEIGLQGEAACGKGVSHLNRALQSSNVEAARVAKPTMNPVTPMRTRETYYY